MVVILNLFRMECQNLTTIIQESIQKDPELNSG